MNKKNEMTTNEVIKLLLNKEMKINNKIINVVSELLRLGYESDRGKTVCKGFERFYRVYFR